MCFCSGIFEINGNKTKYSSSKIIKKLLRNSQLISFSFLATELLENREFLSRILWVMPEVRKKHLATDFEFAGTEIYDKPEVLYRSFLLRRIMKMSNGQSNFSTRFFGWKFRGILGNFFGGWEKIWRVCWVLESGWNSGEFHRCTALWRRLKTDRAKSPKNSSHFRAVARVSWVRKQNIQNLWFFCF